MKIAVLGAGAMGMLFGGYLSRRNEVYLVEVNEDRVRFINENGLRVREKDGTDGRFFPRAVSKTEGLGPVDLIIVFVKAMFTVDALSNNRSLIGPDTYIMTLQNGAGHEEKLLQFADEDHVVIGSTKHASCILEEGKVFHSGIGQTIIGLVSGSRGSEWIAEELTECGFPC